MKSQDVLLVEMDCREFYASWNSGSPSLVFVDAGHSYEAVRTDIAWAVQVSASVVCGDDYSWPGVERAVNEAFGGRHTVRGDLWAVQLYASFAPRSILSPLTAHPMKGACSPRRRSALSMSHLAVSASRLSRT